MSKVAVSFWSGTGNTEAMAEAVVEGIKNAGGEAVLVGCDLTAADVDSYDAFAFGCPSMGDEVLEEAEFEPMWEEVKEKLEGKKVALFGSYGWGDGEWMRNWDEEAKGLGVVMACDFVICNEEPDDDGLEECRKLGAALV